MDGNSTMKHDDLVQIVVLNNEDEIPCNFSWEEELDHCNVV